MERWQRKPTCDSCSPWKLTQRVRSEKGGIISAVDGGTVLLDKKTPAEEVLGGCFEPVLITWGPCWSFRRFGLADATHRSKEGSPFVSVGSKGS